MSDAVVLVTGGAGFIGSHTCVELLQSGHSLVVVDNLENSSPKSLERVSELTGKPVPLERVDLRDELALAEVFSRHDIGSAIHFQTGAVCAGISVSGPSARLTPLARREIMRDRPARASLLDD